MATNDPEEMDAADARVLLDMSVDQAESVIAMLDLASRIHMGQIEEISSLANQRLLMARDDGSDKGVALPHGSVDDLEELMMKAKGILGHPRTGSFGIGARGVSIDAKRGYEVQKVLQKAVHDHVRPEVRHTTASQGVIVRYGDGTVPTATVKTA